MKKICFLLVLLFVFKASNGQFYTTKNGFTGFYSKTPFEDIIAENNQVYAVMDIAKKTLAFSMLMKGFIFKKELMQEHFNENYAESDKYPKATFTGTFNEVVDVAKDQNITLHISGIITLHGVSKPLNTTAILQIQNDLLNGNCSFALIPGDFNITIPSLVKEKIAKEINVQVKISLHQ
ncbi:MAG: YceI family protein [Parafilimonas sp.]